MSRTLPNHLNTELAQSNTIANKLIAGITDIDKYQTITPNVKEGV